MPWEILASALLHFTPTTVMPRAQSPNRSVLGSKLIDICLIISILLIIRQLVLYKLSSTFEDGLPGPDPFAAARPDEAG